MPPDPLEPTSKRRARPKPAPTIAQRLVSIPHARHRAGGVSNAMFYEKWLPHLRTVKIGRRRLVDISSLDELIDKLLEK